MRLLIRHSIVRLLSLLFFLFNLQIATNISGNKLSYYVVTLSWEFCYWLFYCQLDILSLALRLKYKTINETPIAAKSSENLLDPNHINIIYIVRFLKSLTKILWKSFVRVLCSCMRFVKLVACWLAFTGNA